MRKKNILIHWGILHWHWTLVPTLVPNQMTMLLKHSWQTQWPNGRNTRFFRLLSLSQLAPLTANTPMFFIDGWRRIVGRYFSCIRSLHQLSQDYGLYTAHIQGKYRSLKPSLRTFQKHLEYLQSQSHHQPLHQPIHHLFHYEICSVGFRRHVRRQPKHRHPGQQQFLLCWRHQQHALAELSGNGQLGKKAVFRHSKETKQQSTLFLVKIIASVRMSYLNLRVLQKWLEEIWAQRYVNTFILLIISYLSVIQRFSKLPHLVILSLLCHTLFPSNNLSSTGQMKISQRRWFKLLYKCSIEEIINIIWKLLHDFGNALICL